MKQSIDSIAREHLHIPSLETQNSDSLDFHDVSVWGIKNALKQAYRMGLEDQSTVLSTGRRAHAWGHTIGSVIRTMELHNFSHYETTAALLSLGVHRSPQDIRRIYGSKYIKPATLTDEQVEALRYRANLYSDQAVQ